MLETSKDLLYIVIAFCVLWFTVFLCWLMFYFISIIKNVYKIIKGIKEKIALLDDMLKNVKSKVDNSAAYVGMIANAAIKVADYVKEKKTKNSATKKKTNKKSKDKEN